MRDIAEKILARVKTKKNVEAEVYLSRKKGLSVEVEKEKVKSFEQSEDWGIGLRILDGKRVGFSSCSGIGSDMISEVIDSAILSAAHAGSDNARSLPSEPGQNYPLYSFPQSDISRVSVEEKIEAARRLEKSGREYDSRITKSKKSAYWESVFEIAVRNTSNVDCYQSGAVCGCSITLVAEEADKMETGWEMETARSFSSLNFESVGKAAAKKAVRMLGAKSLSTGVYPVVFDNYISMEFLGLLSSSLCADNVQKGKSMFAGKKGINVASPFFNLIDCGFHDECALVFTGDSEGVPVARKELISNGVLNGFLYDTYTATRDGITSTGNGFRNSYKNPPSVGTAVLYVYSENVSPLDDIIGSIDKGIFVTEAMGVHTANPVTGDFSFGIEGILIESGELSFPVRGIMVSGNIIEMIRHIEMIENKLRFFGKTGAPAFKISSLSVSGQ